MCSCKGLSTALDHISGDRVQWARAEADMDRFQEQMEAKLAEFLRCSVAFQTNAENWTKMSAQVERGYGEYARQTTAMWLRLVNQSEDHLCKAGYKFALKQDFNLVDFWRASGINTTACSEIGASVSLSHFIDFIVLLSLTILILLPRDKRAEAVKTIEMQKKMPRRR